MKKLLCALALVLMTVASCSKEEAGGGNDEPQKQPEITIGTTSSDFSTEGGSKKISFTSSGAWTAEAINTRAASWCSVNPTSGPAGSCEISISVTANDTPDNRTASVVIKSGTISKTISVSQKQKDAIVLAKSSYNVNYEGGQIQIEVGHNVDFGIEISSDWITEVDTRALVQDTITFNIAENTTSENREGEIAFSKGNLVQKVKILQGALNGKQIKYKSSDGNRVVPNNLAAFGAEIVSNEYKDGVGVITFDKNITDIGEGAFNGCSNLAYIELPEGLLSIKKLAFQSCSQLETIAFPNSVTSIGDYAFQGCRSLTTLTLPNSLTSIGDYVFCYCEALTTITLPNGLLSIGKSAFQICKALTTITLPSSLISIGESAFAWCSSLTTLILPNNLTSIEKLLCYECKALTAVTLPDNLISIGKGAFTYCIALSSLTLPNCLTSIGDYAFQGCQNLTTATLPNSLASIGVFAFGDCSNLANIYSEPMTPPSIGSGAFDNVSRDLKIYVPTSSEAAYKSAWSNYSSKIYPYTFED